MHSKRRVAVGNLTFGLDNGVVVERVVVDDESAVLHEDRTPGVLVAGRPQHPLVVGRARDPSGEIKRLAPDRRRRLGRDSVIGGRYT